MNEKQLSRTFKDRIEKSGFKARSFERFGFDVPDYHVIHRASGETCWIELKIVESYNSRIPFRQGQPQWLDAYVKDGGKSFVLVYVESTQEINLIEVNKIRMLHRLKLVDVLLRQRNICIGQAWPLLCLWLVDLLVFHENLSESIPQHKPSSTRLLPRKSCAPKAS